MAEVNFAKLLVSACCRNSAQYRTLSQ